MEKATVGRIVHFHPSPRNGYGLNPDDVYAAIVVGVPDDESSRADLHVFPTPGVEPTSGYGFGSVLHDDDADPEPDELADDATDEQRAEHEAAHVPAGTWGWPPRS